MASSDSPLSEEEWIKGIRQASSDRDVEGFRRLLNTEHGRIRLEGFNLDPEKGDDIRAMMAGIRKHTQEGDNFRRSVLSEGTIPNEIERMAIKLGITPETL